MNYAEVFGPRDPRRMEEAYKCLRQLNFPEQSLGTLYLAEALEVVSRRPELNRSLSRHLYPYLAALHATTAVRVERDIRYAIEAAWSRCSPVMAEAYFGYATHPDKGKATNRECIATLAEYIARRSG